MPLGRLAHPNLRKRKLVNLTIPFLALFIFSKPSSAAFESLRDPLNIRLNSNLRHNGEISLIRDHKWGLSELDANHIRFAARVNQTILSASWSSSGGDVYRENSLAAGAAYEWRGWSVGAAAAFLNLAIRNYGGASAIAADAFFGRADLYDWEAVIGIAQLPVAAGRLNRHIQPRPWAVVRWRHLKSFIALGFESARDGMTTALKAGYAGFGSVRLSLAAGTFPAMFGGEFIVQWGRMEILTSAANIPPLGINLRTGLSARW